jgi:hypothetical protein
MGQAGSPHRYVSNWVAGFGDQESALRACRRGLLGPVNSDAWLANGFHPAPGTDIVPGQNGAVVQSGGANGTPAYTAVWQAGRFCVFLDVSDIDQAKTRVIVDAINRRAT